MTEFDRSQYLTTGEVARLLGVSSESVRRWCTQAKVPALVTAGGMHLIHRDDVDKLRPRPVTES